MSAGRRKAEAVLAALDALDDYQLIVVADHIGDRLIRAGAPLPPLTTMAHEAECWAALASVKELKTYVAAAVIKFSHEDRAGLADYLRKQCA